MIAAILMGMAGLGVVQVARGFVQTREAGELAQKSDFVLTRIRKSVRNLMGVNSAATNTTTLSLSRLDSNQAPVTEIFSYSGTTLSLGNGTTSAPLMEGISAFQFQYFKEDEDNNPWNPATDPVGELAIVDVSLTMAGDQGVSVAFSERILPRNTYTPSRAYTPSGAGTPSAQGICLLEALYPNSPVLWSLFRGFRDNGLAAIPLAGKKITSAYYLTGSAVTPWLTAHPGAIPFLRWLTVPVVALLFFWTWFPAGLLALAVAAWIFARLFTFLLLRDATARTPLSRRFRTAGSILLSLVITIMVVALLGAGAVSILTTSQHGNVHSALGEKAYYLAESGLRYAVSQFMANQDNSANFISALSSTEGDGAFSVSTGEAFNLGARCFFFDPDNGAPGTTLLAYGDGFPGKLNEITVPGGGLSDRMEVYDTGIGDRTVVNATVSAINTGTGTITYTITGGLAGSVDPDEYVLPVASVRSDASNIRASNLGEAPTASQISLKDDGFAGFFPAARGVVSLMADADKDGSHDDRIDLVYDRLNGTTLQGLRNVPGKEPLPDGGVDIAADTPVVLGRYASITSRGMVARNTSQETAVQLTLSQPLDTVDIMRMIANTTPGEQSVDSVLGTHTLEDNALKVVTTDGTYSFIESNNPTLQQESVAAQDWEFSDMTGGSDFLKELWLRSDKRMSYETQVKVKFTETEDDLAPNFVNHPGCYMPGIAFRLRQVGPHPGQSTYYGMSFMRGIAGRTQHSTDSGCGQTTWKSEDDDISDNLFADHGSNSAFTYTSTCPDSDFTPTIWNDNKPLDGIPYLIFWQKDQSTNADGSPLSTGCGGSVSEGYSPFEWLSYMPLVAVEKCTLYQYDNTIRARVYSNRYYGGDEAGFPGGEFNLAACQDRGMNNDDVQSVRVTSGYTLTLYEHDNFGGKSLTRTSDFGDLGLILDGFWSWANETSSLKVTGPPSSSAPWYDGPIAGQIPSYTRTAWKLTDPYGLFKTYTINGVEVLGLPGALTIMDPATAFDAGGPKPVANAAYIVFPGSSSSADKRDLNYRLYLKEWATVGLQIFEIEGDLDCNPSTGTGGVERVNAVSAFFGSNTAAGNTAQAGNSRKDGNRNAYPASTAENYLAYPVKWLNNPGYFTQAVWDGLGIQNTNEPNFPTEGGYTSKLVPNPYGGSGCGGNTDIKLVEKGKDLEGDNTHVYSATFLTVKEYPPHDGEPAYYNEYNFDTEYIPEIGLHTLGISAEPGAAANDTETAYFKDWYWRFFEGGQTGMVPGIISE